MQLIKLLKNNKKVENIIKLNFELDNVLINKTTFNNLIYTPLDLVIKELAKRAKDKKLETAVVDSLPFGIPDIFKDKKNAIFFRQLATPNYELRRFVSITDGVGDLRPVFFEYFEDKFTSNNEWKKALGKMSFYFGKGKKGGLKIDQLNVIDSNSFNGKKISSVKTLCGQKLVDFHHELFDKTYAKIGNACFFDASEWFLKSGGTAKDYYKIFLKLFLKHGILFENFMIDQKEIDFTREVFLSAFMAIEKEYGFKPLIVALEPTDIESDKFWMCHPEDSIQHIKSKLKLI